MVLYMLMCYKSLKYETIKLFLFQLFTISNLFILYNKKIIIIYYTVLLVFFPWFGIKEIFGSLKDFGDVQMNCVDKN